MHQERSFEPLQPIMSSHGGEITSRTSRKSSPRPMDYNLTANNYPMRQSPIRAQTPGVNQPHMSQLQSRQNANDYYSLAGDSKQHGDNQQHHTSMAKTSCNDSSVQNKLSQLRNVFTAIRQNLQDESSATGGHTQSVIQNEDYL